MRALHRIVSHASTPHASPPPLDLSAQALFLDLDGTLVEIEQRPHAVAASTELRALLHRLARAADGALAVVTGRTIADADRVLHGAVDNLAGVHGYEMQRDGRIFREAAPLSPIAAAAADIRALLQAHALSALVEDKHASLALHYRHAPETGPHTVRVAHDIAARHGLRVLQGKMVVELVAGARTKGDALRAFMRHPPFAGRTPVALGDDLTDEDGFAAAAALGGFGVLVGAARPSAAAFSLAGPSAVHAWLAGAPAREEAR